MEATQLDHIYEDIIETIREPFILCTGYSKKISNLTPTEIGIKAFVYKPVAKADLAETVRKVLYEAKGNSCT